MIDPSQLDFVLPDGTRLRDATAKQCERVGEWLLAIARQLQPHETPSSRGRSPDDLIG